MTKYGVTVTSPTSEMGQHIINLMCENPADGILMQCSQENGFSQDNSLRENIEDLNYQHIMT